MALGIVVITACPELIVLPAAYALVSFLPVAAFTFAVRRRFGEDA